MKNVPEQIVKKILATKENKLKKLDLSNDWGTGEEQMLTELPNEIGECTALEELDLSFNSLKSLPESITNLQNLQTLNLFHNKFVELPEGIENLRKIVSLNFGWNSIKYLPNWIIRLQELENLSLSYNKDILLPSNLYELQKLTSLDIGGNQLKSFPDLLFAMSNLEALNIRGNSINHLPLEILQMSSLREIHLGDNPLSDLPEWITQMHGLEELDLNMLGLSHVPEWIARMEQLTALRLSDNALKIIPTWIGQLTNLERLDISGNELTGFPEAISKLSKLKYLDLGKCKLRVIPNSISELRNLETLSIIDNKIKGIPKWIIQLPELTYLNLSSNSITTLPDFLGDLRNLETLWLVFNRISNIPDSIVRLENLSSLGLAGNFLSTLPSSFAQLRSLTMLNLCNNLFDSIPDSVYELSSLKTLIFSNESFGEKITSKNQIKEISPKILQLQELERFTVDDNPVETPPPEVVSRGVDAIKNYFRQIEKEGQDYLYEAKLLIVGEGGAGKTSLSKKILNPDFELVDAEKSTEGIEVNEWRFDLENGQPFRVNIWDFGGQEIYHSTHQFFLTKRSLYLLVADTRKEDTDFYYWLNAVDLLTDGSPIIVIKNEKQDRHREINERQLRGQFSNLKETLSTNLATNRGLNKIIEEIKHYICKLPHIGTPLPKTWVKVREVLENDHRNYIALHEYLEICEQNGFTRLEDKLQLSGYLHDLGVCLHFQEDPILKKVVILKPKWGTDAVYKVLDNKTVIGNLGTFNLKDLSLIWQEEGYDDMHAELLQLMINFRLCYKLPNSDFYIAPQLLSENKAQYEWPNADNLLLRYTYEFMPKGIITQFIVAMNSLIVKQSLVWKSGVLIEDKRTTAEVVEYYDKREIKIRVTGKHKKDLLTIVSYELDKIHASYNRLKYSKWIPCNCAVCKRRQDPHFYSFDILQKFIDDKQFRIQCQTSYEMVSVTGLIDDVINNVGSLEAIEAISNSGNVFKGPVGTVVIQYPKNGSGETMMQPEKQVVVVKSAWANGSFYLFTFAVVITGLGVLARSVSGYALGAILIAGILFIPVIGGLQLRQDDRLSEKTFIELIKLALEQLPLIGNLFKSDKINKNQGD
jgi:small GTP-binding protein